ncbi:hypothetical protein BDV97DRAFT_398607 [Delphinella strobiligena]|nr:hypothetical protein BDV97DRAFT_398607 [Delphinella strobiligena]
MPGSLPSSQYESSFAKPLPFRGDDGSVPAGVETPFSAAPSSRARRSQITTPRAESSKESALLYCRCGTKFGGKTPAPNYKAHATKTCGTYIGKKTFACGKCPHETFTDFIELARHELKDHSSNNHYSYTIALQNMLSYHLNSATCGTRIQVPEDHPQRERLLGRFEFFHQNSTLEHRKEAMEECRKEFCASQLPMAGITPSRRTQKSEILSANQSTLVSTTAAQPINAQSFQRDPFSSLSQNSVTNTIDPAQSLSSGEAFSDQPYPNMMHAALPSIDPYSQQVWDNVWAPNDGDYDQNISSYYIDHPSGPSMPPSNYHH